jgi:eukaryotic-like serine/threonine-protein kinase
VILYEMLTGGRAFRKPTSAETMTAILNEEPAPISQIVPSVPPGLQRTVARCLAKDPEKRFQHASDLAFALEAFSDSATSPPIPTQQPFRLRWPWVAAALAILGIVAVLTVWWNLVPAVPVVESITQLTDDGEQKLTGQVGALLATDGSRVYFEEGPTGSMRLAQVSVSGGRTGFIDSPRGELLQGISSDGSALLVLLALLDNNVTLPLWSIPIPAGEPRRLSDWDATCATYFPDGRLLVIKGSGLYIADKDGSNPRPLTTLDQRAWLPSISADGKRIVVTVFASGKTGLTEITVDGSTPPRSLGQDMFRGTWSYDGKYLIYGTSSLQGSDLWALPMHTGWYRRATKPIRLTNGALWFMGSLSSRDGKQLFTIGNKPHSELVHFDIKSRQFVPFFGGLSAISPTFSSDGKWVEYTSYPDHSLWRSRSDGTDRMQLTFPPVEVAYPNISPDSSKVVFGNLTGQLFIVSMQGGAPEMVVDSHGTAGLWSPDSKLLVLTSFRSGPNGKNHYFLRILDTRTRQLTEVPGSEGMVGGMWVTEDTIVAANQDGTEFNLFNSRTGKWNHLLSGRFVNWAVSRDGQYLVFTTGGADPQAQRLRIVDRHLETLTSLTNLRRVVDPIEGQTQLTLAPTAPPSSPAISARRKSTR